MMIGKKGKQYLKWGKKKVAKKEKMCKNINKHAKLPFLLFS
jgi:hypothetical protein